jgi:hypothetical protein
VTKTINWPATVRELGDMAAQQGLNPSELLEQLERDLGPMPMPPADYTLAKGSETRWIGAEIVKRRWIITPSWDSTTNVHSLALWMADHKAPTYAQLSPSEALELAADLAAAAQALEAARDGE